MRLDRVSAVLRPRSDQEAADFGMALVRRHAGGIFMAWFSLLLPLWALLIVVLRDYPSLTVFIIWWLKPIYDRVVVFYLGRALFGDAPSLRAQWRAWPKLLTRRMLPDLLWRRFSPVRSFVMAVPVLENLSGKPAAERMAALKRHGGAAAASMTSMTGFLEIGVLLALMAVARSFVPEEWVDPILDGSLIQNPALVMPGLLWSMAACYLVAVALVEPFYAGAVFGLYINTRTLLEGWDVEVAFRRLGARLRDLNLPAAAAVAGNVPAGPPPIPSPAPPVRVSTVNPSGPPALPSSVPAPGPGPGLVKAPGTIVKKTVPPVLPILLGVLLSGWLSPCPAPGALVDHDEARESIKEVLSHPDFINHKEKYKEWVADSPPSPSSSPTPPVPERPRQGWDWSWIDLSGLRNFFSGSWTDIALRLLLVVAIASLAGWLGWLIYRKTRGGLKGWSPELSRVRGPRTVMGLEVAPESLPPDIPGEAWGLWSRGDSLAAVRLLYRGALAWLVERGALPIRESDTEGDCLRHAARLGDAARGGYFRNLTSAWQGSAYGGLAQGESVMRELCSHWPFSLSQKADPADPPDHQTNPLPSSATRSPSSAVMLLLLACVSALTLTGCGQHIEEKERETGYRGEARRDPWLAASRFLTSHAYHVDSGRGLTDLPAQNTMLVVPSDAVPSEAFARIALNWAEDGGHLIYLVHGGDFRRDDWNDDALRRSTRSGGDSDTREQPLLKTLGLTLENTGSHPRVDKVDIGGTSCRVSMGEEVVINTTQSNFEVSFLAGGEDHAALASLACGYGRVTVLAQAHLFRNRFIGDDDHAALLLTLARLEPHVNSVRFIRSGKVSLMEMLREHAWRAVAGLAVLLTLWLWRCLPRFGPVCALPTRSQRRFATHLEEAGQFLWRQRMAEVLLQAPRQAVLAAARRTGLRETEVQFYPLLAARSGLSQERVQLAMEGPASHRDSHGFTRQMADLQKIQQSF